MENQSSETIKKFASFTTLSGEQTQLIYNKRYKKGAVLFKQGENSRDLYILNSGVLEVLVDGSPVAQIDQRGVFFGEMASILHEARNATVRVKVECNCLVIPAGFVNKVLFTKPEIGLSLIKLLARRLKETTRNLTMMQKMYFSLKQEFLKKQDAAETGAGKSPYDIMIELDLITKVDLMTAVEKQEQAKTEGLQKTVAQILIDEKKISMTDMLQILKNFKTSDAQL